MSETRKIGYAPHGGFYESVGKYLHRDLDAGPTDADRVELAIAALTHGKDVLLPDANIRDDTSLNVYRRDAVVALVDLRAALARDAAANEQERAEEEAVEALRSELTRASLEAGEGGISPTATRRAYELGARAPQVTTDGGES